MTKIIDEMFSTATTETTSSRSLAGTAQLTSLASELTNKCISALNDDLGSHEPKYREQFAASRSNHDAMDSLINELLNLSEVDIDFIKQLDAKTVDGMLKSQQSKRSRAKSKAMTMDNYKSMMSGAIAENLIRIATGKTKNAVGARRAAGTVEYTTEELDTLKNDQERLKKELRNIQSKKSIMKSKADFSEDSERWQKLLEAEAQLKSLRVSTRGTTVVKVDTTKTALAETLSDIDIDHLKSADSKALLAKIKALLGND